MQKKSHALTFVSVFCLFVLAPVLAFFSYKFLGSKYYYIAALGMVFVSILPFFVMFEKRKITTAEIVTVSVMISLCVSSRLLFAFVPQIKPLCAFVVMTAIAFGGNVGFVTGAISMFVSNFAFGQGMFTPFQMLGMGLVGFLCGEIFHGRKLSKNRVAVSIIGGVLTFFLYGFIVDTCSVLMMATDYSLKSILSIYASGVVFNLVHGVTTGAVLFFLNKPMQDKLSRLNTKYGIFSYEVI